MNVRRGLERFVLLCAGVCLAASARAQEPPIYVGQVVALTGPASSIGIPLTQAANALFKRVNASGGIAGHRLELVARDDGFIGDRTLPAARKLIEDYPVVALINTLGAPTTQSLVTSGFLKDNGLDVVGAFTGSTSVRALVSPNIFFVRASVDNEGEQMVQQMATLGITRIGVVHANDAFGKDGRSSVEAALARRNRKLTASGAYEPATVDVDAAVKQMAGTDVQAILLFGTAPAIGAFVRGYKAAGGGALLVGSSSTSAEGLTKVIGNDLARGTGLVEVVPSLRNVATPIVKDYLDTMAKYGEAGVKPSAYGLEGFIAAKVLVEGLRHCGAQPTRARLASALAELHKLDLGGFSLDYSGGTRLGSRWVEIGILGADGRVLN